MRESKSAESNPHGDAAAAPGAARFVPLRAVSALGRLIERSHEEPVVVFQHDPYCPISRRAYHEVAGLPIEAALVDVAREASISRMIEERTGVPHQSPQLLVLRRGQVVWSASHFGITRGAVTRALRRVTLANIPEEDELVCGAACARGGNVLRDRSTESPGLATWLRSAWDSQ